MSLKRKLLIIIGLVVLLALLGIVSFIFSNLKRKGQLPVSVEKVVKGRNLSNSFDPSHGTCKGTGTVPFTSPPLPMDKIGIVEPMGQMIGGHVTPIDHGYIFGNKPRDQVTKNEYPVLSPADGRIVGMSATVRGEGGTGTEGVFVDHAITISFTCSLYVHFLNMDSFDEHILKQSGKVKDNSGIGVDIPVKAGEVIGHTGKFGIDVFVWNADLTLTGFVKPQQYTAAEDWKTHTADPYEYFAEPVKSQLLAKNPRVVTPRGGKIDYDVGGKLVGNWFKEGTGGYSGNKQGDEGYWLGHLSIVYDAYDPVGIMISIGNWDGEAMQFGVKGNAPDPKGVDTATGLVKYELLQPDWSVSSTGARWNRETYAGPVKFAPDGPVQGVVLVQMVEKQKIKVEFFPGKTASQISAFTDKATVYER